MGYAKIDWNSPVNELKLLRADRVYRFAEK
jgi:hypothetical protein